MIASQNLDMDEGAITSTRYFFDEDQVGTHEADILTKETDLVSDESEAMAQPQVYR